MGFVIIAEIFSGITLPMLPVQILWINMTTAVLLGLMLAFEPKEPGIMTRRPRNPKKSIFTWELTGRIVSISTLLLIGAFGLFKWQLTTGSSIEQARTVSVNVFVMVQLFYLFNCRSLTQSIFTIGLFSNKWLYSGVIIMFVLQILYTYLPLMNLISQSAPISLDSWLKITALALITYFIVGFEKLVRQILKR